MAKETHFESAGRLMDQAAWTSRRKQAVWRKLVRMKIHRQCDLLKLMNKEVPPKLYNLADQVKGDDDDLREAVAARMYFPALLGKDFRRHGEHPANAALNYGYAILSSSISRCIAMHGYSTALGIHHCSRDNPVNLTCDIMEPFRPFVDRLVAQAPDRSLDWIYMKELILLTETGCKWNGDKTTLAQAIDCMVMDVLRAMEEPRSTIGEVYFD